MFNLGGMELLVIMAVALLVLGPDKLPSVMRKIGKTVGELRKATTDFQRTMNVELDGIPEIRLPDDQEPENRAAPETLPPSPAEPHALERPEPGSRKRALPRARARSGSRKKTASRDSGGMNGNNPADSGDAA